MASRGNVIDFVPSAHRSDWNGDLRPSDSDYSPPIVLMDLDRMDALRGARGIANGALWGAVFWMFIGASIAWALA